MRAALILALACCNEPDAIERREVAVFPAVESRQLDLLFLIDNSGSTSNWQVTLADGLPALLGNLADSAPLSELHVGIVTPDMGTTASSAPDQPAAPIGSVGNGGCANAGDAGVLRTAFVDGRATLPSELAAALRVGSSGCGFEQHLHAIRRAREGNPGFWRADASTAIIALVDEDDCSVLAPTFFSPDAPQDPLVSYRCTRRGVACDEPIDTVGPKTNCRPRTSSLVEDPALTFDASPRTTFSVIAGPADPFAIEQRVAGGVSMLALAHACRIDTPTGPQVADPSPRLAALARSFSSRGAFDTVCQPSYAGTLAAIAKTIERSLGVACLDDALDVDLATCVAFDVAGDARTELPTCPAARDCFDITADTARCGGGLRVTIDRKSTPAATTHVEVACARATASTSQ